MGVTQIFIHKVVIRLFAGLKYSLYTQVQFSNFLHNYFDFQKSERAAERKPSRNGDRLTSAFVFYLL